MGKPACKSVSVVPAIVYRDCNAAIEWLKTALGFTECVVYRNDAGIVQHAEMLFGDGMVMLGTAGNDTESSRWYAEPSQCGGRVTSTTYLIVPVCAPLYASAQAAGAEILSELRTMAYGGGAFTVRDPEGHVWSVGEYDPWNAPAAN